MSYAIVYSSETGNTEQLAMCVKEILSDCDLKYCGKCKEAKADADVIFIGFWTDRGSCDEGLAGYLKTLYGKKIFLFGTAGFGGSQEYYEKVLANVQTNIDESNQIIGKFMCQGKMPMSSRKRYEAMLTEQPEKAKRSLENFDRALSHPDTGDLNELERCVKAVL